MSEPEAPSAKLALLVVDCLIEGKLLRTDKREQLADKIAGGKMAEGDWKLEIELASGGTTGA